MLSPDQIAAITGAVVRAIRPLATGHNAMLSLVDLADGRRLVAKSGHGLETEGAMLRYLAERTALPVPFVYAVSDALLLMDFVPTSGGFTTSVEEHAADLLADLHGIPASRYGFPHPTPIGPLPQTNAESEDWIAFFRDHRLLAMARAAHDEGAIERPLLRGIERLAGRLDELIGSPAPPALIHGDLWGGNILVRDGRIAAVIDPALYHADPEIELAFVTLFGTLGDAFFRRYAERRPLRPGFFEVRRDLYNLYPLLVHVRLFGGGYVGGVERTVRRFLGG